MSDRVIEVIEYIESLKTNLEKSKEKKEKLLSSMRLHEYMASDNNGASTSQSLDIQIHEMDTDVDIVLIAGLKNHSVFCDIIQVLNQYSTEVVHASFSSCGPSTFHVHHKKIEAAEMYRRLKELCGGSSKKEELDIHTSPCKELEANLDSWDFEVCYDVLFNNN